ncbi:MAG: DUF58 domain-containing protein [Myxococcales bacterium]|nr:DUF58 domain-containing protein [Myxococcales bacterium]
MNGAEAGAGRDCRYLPGRLLWVLALPVFPLVLIPDLGVFLALGYAALLAVAAVYEARTLGRAAPEVQRRAAGRLVLGVPNEITLRLRNASALPLKVYVRDDYPDAFEGEPEELSTRVPGHGRAELSYQVVPTTRGEFAFGSIHLRVEGLLGLGAAIVSVPSPQTARVYPNLRGPKRYELAVRLGALQSVGVRSMRLPGGGGEFEQLREYVPGDPYRDVDWKATAKRRRPVTRINGQERSQTVIVAVDAGRMMATRLDAISKLDHAINAALLLSYVALRQGDRVGLVVFAETVVGFVPPRRGLAQYQRILESLYRVQASITYVDFRRLTEFVRTRVPRRALLVVFSDLLDDSQALPLSAQAPLLRQKHLPLCVTMSDPVAERLAHEAATDVQAAYRRAAAADILSDREAIKSRLRKAGVSLVEAPASELAVATVNRYLAIKSRRVL